jgi:hypothetical protein
MDVLIICMAQLPVKLAYLCESRKIWRNGGSRVRNRKADRKRRRVPPGIDKLCLGAGREYDSKQDHGQEHTYRYADPVHFEAIRLQHDPSLSAFCSPETIATS